MIITPYIFGSGLAGKALAKSLVLLNMSDEDLKIDQPTFLSREATLSALPVSNYKKVLLIANPDALHTPRILEGVVNRFDLIVCEKPTSVDAQQLAELQPLTQKVAVLHVYRQLWGIQHMRSLIEQGELGSLVSIEGKMWQSSKVRKLSDKEPQTSPKEWRNDISLMGRYGVSLGLGTHWLDTAKFLAGKQLELCGSRVNSEHGSSEHDDTYFHIQMQGKSGVYIAGSICNMAHGATNDFEINVLGTNASVNWRFMQPDEMIFSRGSERHTIYRASSELGSRQPAFHGLGWLEGYIEIIRQSFRDLLGLPFKPYPTLQESNWVIKTLLYALNCAK